MVLCPKCGNKLPENAHFCPNCGVKTATRKSIIFLKGIGELLFLFGLLGWLYGVLVQFIHPEWLPLTLSHLIPWIRVDTFTIISFIISAVGFLIWRLTREALLRFS